MTLHDTKERLNLTIEQVSEIIGKNYLSFRVQYYTESDAPNAEILDNKLQMRIRNFIMDGKQLFRNFEERYPNLPPEKIEIDYKKYPIELQFFAEDILSLDTDKLMPETVRIARIIAKDK